MSDIMYNEGKKNKLGGFMVMLHAKNIRNLQKITREYHESSSDMLAAFDAKNYEEAAEISKKCSNLQKKIMDELEANTFSVVTSIHGKIVIKQKNLKDLYAFLKPLDNSKTVAKFFLEVVEYENATVFETKEDAEKEIEPLNYAVFFSYIRGIGSRNKKVG